jgi:mannan endo-1,4-beta-mannosidase
MKRRQYLTTIGALSVGATGVASGREVDEVSSKGNSQSRQGTTLTGIFQQTGGRIDGFTDWIGQTPAVQVSFAGAFSWSYPPNVYIPTWMDRPWQTGTIPLITWMPMSDGNDQNIAAEIATGKWDAKITEWARAIETWVFSGDTDRRLYFRPAHEMNGDWYPWSGDAAAYIEMWKRLQTLFEEETRLSNTHIQWVWGVNNVDVGDISAEAYYPGDRYVDWIGVDGFNFGDSQPWSSWKGVHEMFHPMVERMHELADKPLMIPEYATGSYRNGGYQPQAKADWITDVLAYIPEANIKMASWFNYDKETDWAVYNGERGTGTFNGVPVYESYKRILNGDKYLPARPNYPRVLTETEFTGQFDA